MSELLKVGRRVEVIGKDVQGTVAFCGNTNFASGKWIGLILDEAKGKNNGTVKGQSYFTCEENYGMFVRPTQVIPLDENGKPIEIKESSKDDVSSSKLRPRQSTIGQKPKPTTIRRKTSPQKTTPTLLTSSSRISLASSRQSLASSRQSLSESRTSLIDSRSHLASPVIEKLEGEFISQIPKRASFIETGFVETLKPQFTPGQVINPIATPSSVEEKLTQLQYQQEVDNRDQQIKDLSEKLETLKIKRFDDREKMKDYDKLKIQIEHLLEFKAKIMESHTSLQRDLLRAKQETKDAIEAKEKHAEEMSELSEMVEMATLDKEMAEEKADTLQLELEVTKEQLEEVKLDLEIIKAEIQRKPGDGDGKGGASAYELKQLEQQNARLRETLVRMRDLTAHEKHEFQKLMKDMDQKKSEIAELSHTKEKLSTRVEELEQQIADLQEQVDAALGAEEMVVLLGEQKLTLEEKVVELKEEVAELEALQDMNDQLVESNVELEADLREELDLANAAIREAFRDRDAAMETIADREGTIGKFRELVQKLQEQSLDLQYRLETETSKPVSKLPEIMDFKKMFSETKAHIKAIDLELRRIDIQQLQQHIKYLSSFMPDTFMNRGGDHDAILVLLLIPRLIYKSEILLSQIKDKFPAVDKIDRNVIIQGHSVEQYNFRCHISFYIYALQTILHQYLYSLNTCTPESLLKVGSSFMEISAQEKVIDGFVELVKRDQLDENIPTETLEKCVSYFNTMFPLLFLPETKHNHNQLLNDYVKLLVGACDGFNNNAIVIRSLMEGANAGDMGLLVQHIITVADQLQQQLKQIKRKLPPDGNITNLGLSKEMLENLQNSFYHANKVGKFLQDVVKTAMQTITTNGDLDKGLPHDKMKEFAINASDRVYEQDDLGPVQSLKQSLNLIVTNITQVVQFLQDNEYDIAVSKKEDMPPPPIYVRAKAVKKDLEETKTLTHKLENKESDIKELRRVLKEKQEMLSEMTIRKELAEKKLGNVNKDYELTIEKLQRKLEEAHNNFKKKEKEFEETLDHLQSDIDSLESEKGEMKERLKLYMKKTSTSDVKSGLSSLQPSSLGPSLPAVVKDSPHLMHEIDMLRTLLHKERDDRLKLQSEKMLELINSMKPLPTFKTKRDSTLDALYREGAELKQEIMLKLATPKFPSIYKAKRGSAVSLWKKHFAEETDKLLDLKRRSEEFQSKVAAEVMKRKLGGYIETDFKVFPTVEMTKAFNETKPVRIGSVKIPTSCLPVKEDPKLINLEVDYNNLQKILQTLRFSFN